MSSTRDSLRGVLEETTILSSMRKQLRESQDLISDLQNLAVVNKEALCLFAEDSPHAKNKLVKALHSENSLLFKALQRALEGESRLEKLNDQLRQKLDNSEEMNKMINKDMTQRMANMMVNLSKAQQEASSKGKSSFKIGNSASATERLSKREVSAKKEISALQTSIQSARHVIRRLKLEKKELLRTNFVTSTYVELKLRNYEDQGPAFNIFRLPPVHGQLKTVSSRIKGKFRSRNR